jgi:class 3 adenylate cyclase
MDIPLTAKWNLRLYNQLSNFVSLQTSRNARRVKKIPNARTMPDLRALEIGASKRMNAAILFFDFENFTAITSHLSPEDTLMILNVATTSVMRVVREWKGAVEKHTGDGIMAIMGTETSDEERIAKEAIEAAQTIKYLMTNDVFPKLAEQGAPSLNFRIGVEMGEVLISRIGLHSMNFLTAVGSPANRASKLESLAEPNGIAIGEGLAKTLHPYLQQFMHLGEDPSWDWCYEDGITPYNYYHYSFDWPTPEDWPKELRGIMRALRTS